MTEHERQTLKALCARTADEKNPVAFTQLIIELDALLEKVKQSSGKAHRVRLITHPKIRVPALTSTEIAVIVPSSLAS